MTGQLLEEQTVHLYGVGDWETCCSLLTNFTKQRDTTRPCRENCPDEGIRPPPIQFDNSEFYGFSEFWSVFLCAENPVTKIEVFFANNRFFKKPRGYFRDFHKIQDMNYLF